MEASKNRATNTKRMERGSPLDWGSRIKRVCYAPQKTRQMPIGHVPLGPSGIGKHRAERVGERAQTRRFLEGESREGEWRLGRIEGRDDGFSAASGYAGGIVTLVTMFE